MTNTFGIYYILVAIVILIIILCLIFMIIYFRTKGEKILQQLIYLIFTGLFIICISLFYHFYNYLTGLKNIILIEGGKYNINILKDGLDFNFSYLYFEIITILLFMSALFVFSHKKFINR